MTSLNIVFAATPEFARPSLEHLHQSAHRIIAVYTQPDRPAGRGRQLQASCIKEWAKNHNVPVYQPLNFKTPEAIEALAQLKPDLMVVIAYGLILPQAVLDIPKLGCINVHASLLPKWRGASPIQQSILNGDKESGVTIMKMDAGMDTGDILTTVTCPIYSHETSGTLHDKLAHLAPAPLLETIDKLANGVLIPLPQSHHDATYAPKIKKEEALINWSETAQEIDQKIRAYSPWPIAYTHFDEKRIRIHQAFVQDDHNVSTAPPGTILSIQPQGITVATGRGTIVIERLQFPGGKNLSVREWLNANRDVLQENTVLK